MRKLLVIAFSLFVLLVVGGKIRDGYVYELNRPIERAVAELRSSSEVARWWRCRGMTRPLLTGSEQAWQLQYSWSGGMGPGEVAMGLSSDGRGSVTSKKNGASGGMERPIRFSETEIATLARVIDETGLLCQSTEPRDGVTVFDLGRYAIQVNIGKSTHELVIDECHTIPDTGAVSELFKALMKHEAMPAEMEWGPYGTYAAPVGCKS